MSLSVRKRISPESVKKAVDEWRISNGHFSTQSATYSGMKRKHGSENDEDEDGRAAKRTRVPEDTKRYTRTPSVLVVRCLTE
jgi:hypothetical protein